MKSFENILPKLVIAPGFVLGFAFIYGFMIWNGVLSMTNSRMLPNYDEFVGLAQYGKLWEMDRWIVALKNLGIFSRAVCRWLDAAGHRAGYFSGSEDSL